MTARRSGVSPSGPWAGPRGAGPGAGSRRQGGADLGPPLDGNQDGRLEPPGTVAPAPERRLVLSVGLRRPTARGAVRAALGLLSVVFAAAAGFGAYLALVSSVSERRAQDQLGDRLRSRVEQAVALAASPTVDGQTTALLSASEGSAMGLLRIAELGVARVVVEGSSPAELARGPGHVRGTPMPGHPGNTVVLGHRTAFGGPFRGLGRLERGDEISLTTVDGRFDYRVERVEELRPGESDVFAQGHLNRLTLATAGAERARRGRLAVVARLQGKPVATGEAPRPLRLTGAERGLAGDPGAWPGVILWGSALAAALALAALAYRWWGRRTAYLVTTPPLLALALLFYERVARLLPSTL